MASGTITLNNSGSTSGGGYLIGKIEWSSSADTASNSSQVTANLFVEKGGSTSATWGYWNYSLTVNGSTVSGSPQVSVLGWVQVGTVTVAAPHEADGTKTISLSGSVSAPSGTSYAGLTTSGSGTAALDAIARASSVSCGNFTAGSAGNISISSASGSFTHTLRYEFGAATGTIISGAAGGTYSWTPSLDLLSQIPNATVGIGTVVCDTYLNGTPVGSSSCGFYLYAPESVKPSVSLNVSLSSGNAVLNGWGAAVKGLTRMNWSASAAGAYGSTVSSCAFSFGGASGAGLSGTTGLLPQAGSFQPSVTVTDSRGRTSTAALDAVAVYDYAVPAISSSAAFRCGSSGTADGNGTCARVQLAASCSSVGGKNSLTLRYRVKPSAGSFGGWTAFDGDEIVSGFSVSASYTVEVSAIDALSGEKSVAYSVPTAAVVLNLRPGGTGIGVGKYSEYEKSVELASDWELYVRGKKLLDLIYPVGSIYLSVLDTSPSALFGGTWEEIPGRFLLGRSGTGYPLGAAGGEETHRLTVEELAPHQHGYYLPGHDTGIEWYGQSGGAAGSAATTGSAGGGEPHNNMPPYLVVCVWKRTA